MKISNRADLESISAAYKVQQAIAEYRVLVCGGGGCVSSGCINTRDAVQAFITENHLEEKASLTFTGCMGLCSLGPLMMIEPEGALYVQVTPDMARDILARHIIGGDIAEEYTFLDEKTKKHIPLLKDIPYFSEQVKIALRNCGKVDYASLQSSIAEGGFLALDKALAMERKAVIEQVKLSGLRGRGGGGFPTGVKWEAGYKAEGDVKYLICNADEGDPGAFMDRSLIESDPFGLIEGMMIGAYAIGCKNGYVYCRAEYPLAIKRLQKAIDTCYERGILGQNCMGLGFEFNLRIKQGAGAFVCGEETALMASIEGERGMSRPRPPFPAVRGLWGKPTNINNVETFANVSYILYNGADWFSAIGTEGTKGTKIFALTGKVKHTGLVEVPM